MSHRVLMVSLLALCAGFAGAESAPRSRTYSGNIMDSTCAGNGNHNAGYKLTGTHTAKDCTLACIGSGAKFVLYNPTSKVTYKLDNQEEPRAFAGEAVRVTGTLDAATETIHVTKITARTARTKKK